MDKEHSATDYWFSPIKRSLERPSTKECHRRLCIPGYAGIDARLCLWKWRYFKGKRPGFFRGQTAGDRIPRLIALQALYPYVSQVRGIDVSGGMVEKYNQAARLEGLSKQQMYAIQGDLSSPAAHPELQGEDFFAFHVIVMSMALHHIENPQELLTRLVERLRDGGAVIIIDWASNDAKPSQQPAGKGSHNVTHDHGDHSNQHGDHPASHTVAHAGFSEDQMQKMLSEAGCSEVDYVLHPEMSRVPPEFGGPKHLFFARGKKGTPQTS